MSRTFVIALLFVLAISGAAVTIWYVVDDGDDLGVATDINSDTNDAVSRPKKLVKTRTEDAVAEDTVVEETKSQAGEAEITADDQQIPDTAVSSSSTPNTSGSTAEPNGDEVTESAAIQEDVVQSQASIAKADSALSFDVIRVEKTGDTVLAGRAPAGSDVRILDGTTLLGTIEADNNGQWAYVLETPLEPGTHELGLQVENSDGGRIKSKDVAIIDVPKGEKSALAVLIPDEEPSVTPSVSQVVQLPKRVDENGISDGELALDTVDYDDGGQTVIGGSSQPGQKVVGYLNNEFVGQGVADKEGRWVVEPEKKIAEGLHQLRIDQVDEGGKVIARVEIPFSRSGKIETLPDERVVTVQPGNSLWRISRAIYGQGGRYAVIYDRNQDQIRNPDLIYPGQIFVLPKAN